MNADHSGSLSLLTGYRTTGQDNLARSNWEVDKLAGTFAVPMDLRMHCACEAAHRRSADVLDASSLGVLAETRERLLPGRHLDVHVVTSSGEPAPIPPTSSRTTSQLEVFVQRAARV